jgi:hypothetical protein
VTEAVPGQIRLREPLFRPNQKRAHGEVVEPVACKSTLPGATAMPR